MTIEAIDPLTGAMFRCDADDLIKAHDRLQLQLREQSYIDAEEILRNIWKALEEKEE